jgi:N-acetylglucosamine-6-phosphate deacetylase
MLIRDGLVFDGENGFVKTDIAVDGGRIAETAQPAGYGRDEIFDASGCYVLPGFVDIHSHGAMNADLCDADAKGIEKMLSYYGSIGVTSVVPAAMSYPEEILSDVIKTATPYFGRDGFGAVLRGINLEGPFLNPKRCGAHNPSYITAPDTGFFNRLYELSGGHILIVGVAPELPNGIGFIREAGKKCVVSLAHTDADYDTAIAAFDAGASLVTHIFNATPPFAHRAPGVIGAAFDRAQHVELIADGVHLHPAAVRAAFAMFGPGRICLVSDSMRAAGMPGGTYRLGGLPVVVKDGRATLDDGARSIAGSVVNLADECRMAISFGIPMEQALRASTSNPAKAAGLYDEIGGLERGKRADIVVWDENLRTRAIFIGGKRVRARRVKNGAI